jgi:hypothetical protein
MRTGAVIYGQIQVQVDTDTGGYRYRYRWIQIQVQVDTDTGRGGYRYRYRKVPFGGQLFVPPPMNKLVITTVSRLLVPVVPCSSAMLMRQFL